MIITTAVPYSPVPIGGVKLQYEVMTRLARRGHEVHVVHYPLLPPDAVPTSWFELDPGVHRYYSTNLFVEAPPDFRGDFAFVESLDERFGLTVLFVQGHGFNPDYERGRMLGCYPKLCRSRWLMDEALKLGVPAHELIHLRPGLDQDLYRLVTPIDDRPPVVSMVDHELPLKGTRDGLAALELVRDAVPDVEVVVFGTRPRPAMMPEWVRYVENPLPEVLVREVYNRSRIFLCPSRNEGFGMPSVEAMACGAALVTVDNGGSRDYAFHGDTALVCDPGDVATMVEHVTTLLRDDVQRRQLAAAGRELVAPYSWDTTVDQVEEVLVDYGRDPDKYRDRR